MTDTSRSALFPPQVLYYFTFTSPNPLAGILDFYLVRNFIKKVRPMSLGGGAGRSGRGGRGAGGGP